MADKTLREALTDIADAIRAKGVTGTMSALEMPTKIASIPSGGGSKYGVSGDSILGDVDANGVLQDPSTPFTFSSNEIRKITGNSQYENLFYRNTAITAVSLPNLTEIGEHSLYYAFRYCTSLTSVDLSSLTIVGISGL